MKTCMLIVVEKICPIKHQKSENISFCRNLSCKTIRFGKYTVVDRISDLSKNIQQQLNEKLAHFVVYSVDESTEIRGTAQLAIYKQF